MPCRPPWPGVDGHQGCASSRGGTRAYARARALCRQVGTLRSSSRCCAGLHRFYLPRAELQTARELGSSSRSMAQRLHDPQLLL